MGWSSFKHYFGETAVGIARNGLMSLACISTVAATLIILGSLYLFVTNVNSMLQGYASGAEIRAVFRSQVDERTARKVVAEIQNWPTVARAEYVSRQDMLKEFGQGAAPNYGDLEADLALPLAMKVQVASPDSIKAVAQRIAALPGVEQVNYGEQIVERLLGVRDLVRTGGVVAVILFGAAALLTVHNTIHLAVTSRQQEIAIMELVGATGWYIRAPFVLEGITHGLIGGGIAVLALGVGYSRLDAYLQSHFSFIPIQGIEDVAWLLAATMLGAGVVFGLLGSYFSLRRVLRVA